MKSIRGVCRDLNNDRAEKIYPACYFIYLSFHNIFFFYRYNAPKI